MTSSAPVVGIDLGGTHIQFGVVDADDRIIGRTHAQTEASRGAAAVLDTVADGVERACAAANCDLDAVGAIGIACAGAVDIPRGIVLSAPNLDWQDVPVRDELERRLGRPVVVENDVNGAVWGEYHLGAGPGPNAGDVLGVWVGTGVGGGLILNGRIHHGDFFTAAEFGHVIIEPDGAPGRRTLEDFSSRTGMRRTIGARLDEPAAVMLADLCNGDVETLDNAMLKRARDAGDAFAIEVIDDAARRLGIAIAGCVTTLAMRHVILGGGVVETLGASFVERIRAQFVADVVPERCRACTFLTTKLEADAGLLGAALLARTQC